MINIIRYMSANSLLANGKSLWTMKKATLMLIIIGIKAIRKNIPKMKAKAQNTSAKITKISEMVLPNHNGSGNVSTMLLKFIHFSMPWLRKSMPMMMRVHRVRSDTVFDDGNFGNRRYLNIRSTF